MSEKRKYTLGEEIFNSVSHGVGAALSIAGTVVLLSLRLFTPMLGALSARAYTELR